MLLLWLAASLLSFELIIQLHILFCVCIDWNVLNLLKVANLSLYAVAFVVFGVTRASTHADIENQVWLFSKQFWSIY